MLQERLCLVALNPTDSVTEGFLPAAAALDLRVTLLTDQPDAHRAAYAGRPAAPDEIVSCDVRDHRAIIDHVDRRAGVAAVFSNSDHLQTQTALAAGYFGLPAKDWRATLRAKNKALMRRHLAGLDQVWSRELLPGNEIRDAPFPCVVKPMEGVASEDVVLVRDAAELSAACQDISRRRTEPLVVEEFLTGDLCTLETVGDGGEPLVLGGFRTTLSPLPYFVETSLVFDRLPVRRSRRPAGRCSPSHGPVARRCPARLPATARDRCVSGTRQHQPGLPRCAAHHRHGSGDRGQGGGGVPRRPAVGHPTVSLLRAVLDTLLREDFQGIRTHGSVVDGWLRFHRLSIPVRPDGFLCDIAVAEPVVEHDGVAITDLMRVLGLFGETVDAATTSRSTSWRRRNGTCRGQDQVSPASR